MSLPHWKYHGHVYPKVRVNGRAVNVHALIAEDVLGRSLPPGAQIHHVDEDPTNFMRSNLVICQDMAYHKLLHMRAAVVEVGGNPNTDLFCNGCRRAKPRDDFHVNRALLSGRLSKCKPCHCAYQSERKLALASRRSRQV